MALSELLDTNKEGVKALYLELEKHVELMERDIVILPLDKDNQQELVHRKLRAEGARKLLYSLSTIVSPKSSKSKK